MVDEVTSRPADAEGLFYRLIVRLHRYSLGRNNFNDSRHWQKGLVLADGYNGMALLELRDTDVVITVRAAYPDRFLHELSRDVQWLIEHEWKGLRCRVMVPCLKPCGRGQPGFGRFEIAKLIESKKRGRPAYPCNATNCGEWQDIDKLMATVPTVHPDADAPPGQNDNPSLVRGASRGLR